MIMSVPGLSALRQSWSEDPLWASVYDWTVEHDHVGGLLWRLGTGSDHQSDICMRIA